MVIIDTGPTQGEEVPGHEKVLYVGFIVAGIPNPSLSLSVCSGFATSMQLSLLSGAPSPSASTGRAASGSMVASG